MEKRKIIIAVGSFVAIMAVLLVGLHWYDSTRDPWVFIGETKGQKFFVNEKTITVENNVLNFSLLSEQQVKNSALDYIIMQMQVSSDGKKIRTVKYDAYYRNGNVESVTPKDGWMQLPSDSIMAQAARYGWSKTK